MFKYNLMNEIERAMEDFLTQEKEDYKPIQHVKTASLDPKKAEALSNITKVADHLNAAAEILDNAGMTIEADVVTAVIELLANKESSVDLKALIQNSKKESVKLEKNLEHTGTPFAFDNNDAKDVAVKEESDAEDCNDASDGSKKGLEMNDEDLAGLERKLDQDFEETE